MKMIYNCYWLDMNQRTNQQNIMYRIFYRFKNYMFTILLQLQLYSVLDYRKNDELNS